MREEERKLDPQEGFRPMRRSLVGQLASVPPWSFAQRNVNCMSWLTGPSAIIQRAVAVSLSDGSLGLSRSFVYFLL